MIRGGEVVTGFTWNVLNEVKVEIGQHHYGQFVCVGPMLMLSMLMFLGHQWLVDGFPAFSTMTVRPVSKNEV